jgi:hypothetical protein
MFFKKTTSPAQHVGQAGASKDHVPIPKKTYHVPIKVDYIP